ncbi:MAG: hypothetical protein WBO09_17280 [Methylocystis silviterrae]|uniref:hypothetical protein n=1 Tax=Methylocystis silviterrae TaxID=2743612 RepID=UPI003C71F0AD
MSNAEAEAIFCRLRWPETDGQPTCQRCGHVDVYNFRQAGKPCCAEPLCAPRSLPLAGCALRQAKLQKALLAERERSNGLLQKGNKAKVFCFFRSALGQRQLASKVIGNMLSQRF